MGSSSSKFRKHLQNGDEVAAHHLYLNNSDLRKGIDPNCSYGDSHQHETPLHYAAKHGMKSLLRIFLTEHGGNPNKTNGRKETTLHCVCMEKNSQFYPVQRRRAECLAMIIKWRGATLKDGEVEKVDLDAQDDKNCTSLHYAAASGLKNCVSMLIQHGSPLFLENDDNETPCDSAEKNGHGEIALYLESKMVFSMEGTAEECEDTITVIDSEEYSGLRAQDLQEAKDQLLVETADMLSVPLFTAEALLRNHEWSREMLLESWMQDAKACCEKCGVTPHNVTSDRPQMEEFLISASGSEPPSLDAMCDICACIFMIAEEPVHMSCDHQFCRVCWEKYLNIKIQEGDAHHIVCPAFECERLVPVEIIENVVSRDMARRYLQFDIKAFVDSNPTMKWCPFPGCARAVRLPDLVDNSSTLSTPNASKIPSDTSRAVDCGNGHYFCWECMGEAHEPCSCENWKKWHQKIADVKPEQLNGTELETESAANCLWLVTNSKPCPNCKSPIQKNEGCNHMKCSKCKHDFCWVCLDQWKRHNSSTGGYFKCNRYEVVQTVEDDSTKALTEAEEKNRRMQELNRFVHYYSRFKNHENSYRLEEPLLSTAKDKMMKLAEAVTDSATAKLETKFVEDAVHQLLKARRVLKCSYVYGYYLDGPGYKKIVFEFMQTELEECTEILSQMVNRLYLRTPRKKIVEQAQICQRKRYEFITAISKGLVPPETPPALRKRRRKYSMDNEDEDLRKAILASIQEVDPANPWIKDASGRHTNVFAVLDWPTYESDDSDSEDPATLVRPPENCARDGCQRPRAQNPRTGDFHNYCSLRCSRADKMEKDDAEVPEVILDEHMDLLRALEMSRLQFLRDQGIISSHDPHMSAIFQSDDSERLNETVPEDTGGDPTYPVYDETSNAECAGGDGEAGLEIGTSGDDGAAQKKTLTPMEELDIELQRVLEMSALSPRDFDPELCRGIELSLKETQKLDQNKSHSRKHSHSRIDETTSTIVSRVPNKSVEDLFHDDCISCRTPQSPVPPSPTPTSDAENSDVQGACGGALPKTQAQPSTLGCSTFGVIKDLSVSNIHTADEDKTKNFTTKDLTLLYRTRDPRACTGQLLAANTPAEDEDRLFLLVSPQSEPSDSAGTEPWAYQTYESISSDATCLSSTDNSSTSHPMFTGVRDLHFQASEDPDAVNSLQQRLHSLHHGSGSLDDVADLSLAEMAENLLRMTEEMNTQIQSGDLLQNEVTTSAQLQPVPSGHLEVLPVSSHSEGLEVIDLEETPETDDDKDGDIGGEGAEDQKDNNDHSVFV